jgi:2,4-dienoyl-CoA reductase-like NADH-dependent reductase (Old Yellow Enzyme family)
MPGLAGRAGDEMGALKRRVGVARLDDALVLKRGPSWAHRVALAPLTNLQSHPDGTLSDDEFRWLVKRAEGGFALTMTCAAHVQRGGQGFPGQLGIFDDRHLPGLSRLAAAIRAAGSVSSVQLQHSARRAEPGLTGEERVSPFDDAETGARALTPDEIETLIEAFVAAALRAEAAGFDGIELHGAHGYMLAAFLDSDLNLRDDGWGGDYDGRTRIFFAILERLRARCRPDFQVGVRLSPERFGIRLADSVRLAGDLMASGHIDYLDMSLWDVFKAPEEAPGTRLIDHFAGLPRHGVALGVAGKILDAARAQACLDAGADFVMIGRGAILHHDWAARALADPGFAAISPPVTRAHLAAEGLGPAFITYMGTWKGFIAEETVDAT